MECKKDRRQIESLLQLEISISYLPKSNLFGFIYCIILYIGLYLFDNEVSFYVYLDGIKVAKLKNIGPRTPHVYTYYFQTFN